jgi:hypothetical protein
VASRGLSRNAAAADTVRREAAERHEDSRADVAVPLARAFPAVLAKKTVSRQRWAAAQRAVESMAVPLLLPVGGAAAAGAGGAADSPTRGWAPQLALLPVLPRLPGYLPAADAADSDLAASARGSNDKTTGTAALCRWRVNLAALSVDLTVTRLVRHGQPAHHGAGDELATGGAGASSSATTLNASSTAGDASGTARDIAPAGADVLLDADMPACPLPVPAPGAASGTLAPPAHSPAAAGAAQQQGAPDRGELRRAIASWLGHGGTPAVAVSSTSTVGGASHDQEASATGGGPLLGGMSLSGILAVAGALAWPVDGPAEMLGRLGYAV